MENERRMDRSATVTDARTLPSSPRGSSCLQMPDQARSLLKPLSERLLFASNFLRHPKMLGSIIPSSRFLVIRCWSRSTGAVPL